MKPKRQLASNLRPSLRSFVRYQYYDDLPQDVESFVDHYIESTNGEPGDRVLHVFIGGTAVCVCFGEASFANAERLFSETKMFNVSEITQSAYRLKNPEQFQVQPDTQQETKEPRRPQGGYLSQFLKRSPKETD